MLSIMPLWSLLELVLFPPWFLRLRLGCQAFLHGATGDSVCISYCVFMYFVISADGSYFSANVNVYFEILFFPLVMEVKFGVVYILVYFGLFYEISVIYFVRCLSIPKNLSFRF